MLPADCNSHGPRNTELESIESQTDLIADSAPLKAEQPCKIHYVAPGCSFGCALVFAPSQEGADGRAERSVVSELRYRNKWAHQESSRTDDAYRALDSIQRLLTAPSRAALALVKVATKTGVIAAEFVPRGRTVWFAPSHDGFDDESGPD